MKNTHNATARPSRWVKEAWPELTILAVYIISRYIFWLKGGTFLARPLMFAKQYLDPVLLKEDLLESLLYLHAQPPLFNFFLGTVLKLSPAPDIVYGLLYKTAGALIPLLLFSILVQVGIVRLGALALTLVFMLNPTLILYENLLYYTYIEIFLILLALFFLVRWAGQHKRCDILLFWFALLCLGMVRSLFHPVFFLMVILFMGLYLHTVCKVQKLTKQFGLYSMIVLLPLCALCLKNIYLYGVAGTSSWTGLSLWIKTNGYDPDTLQNFHDNGLISRVGLQAELEPFQPISNYFDEQELGTIPCHHPADCSVWRSTGKPNYNHSGFATVSRQLLKDARVLIAHNPGMFAFFTAGSYSLTLWHSSDSVHALFEKNMEIVATVEKVYRFLYFGFLGVTSKQVVSGMWIRTIIITVFFLMVYLSTLMHLFRKESSMPLAVKIVCLFCLLIHAYTLSVSSLIEFGENNRFRAPVDSVFLVMLAGNIVAWSRTKKHCLM